MIYLSHTTEEQEVLIPKSKSKSEGSVFLKLVGTTSHAGIRGEVQLVEETSFYYRIKVKLTTEIAPGEYEYDFYDKYDVLSSGILEVVASNRAVEYNKTIVYEQYTAD